MTQKLITTYAQNREDLILQAYFRDVQRGYYVDVGANHPHADSVTKLFYMKGWRGINIEPNVDLHALLMLDRPHDLNLRVGVSNADGELTFTEYGNHGLSTFSSAQREEYEIHPSVSTDKKHEYSVPVKTLAGILREAGVTHIHFLKVDVEGYEYEVLEGNDWNAFRPEMICIEANHITRDWRPLLKRHGYEEVFFDGLNAYYLAKESGSRRSNFDYPEEMLLKGVVAPMSMQQAMRREQEAVALGDIRYRALQQRLAESHTQNWWYENAPTRWAAMNTLRSLDRAIERRLNKKPATGVVFSPSTADLRVSAQPNRRDIVALAATYHSGVSCPQTVPSTLKSRLMALAFLAYRIVRKTVRLMAAVLSGRKHGTRAGEGEL